MRRVRLPSPPHRTGSAAFVDSFEFLHCKHLAVRTANDSSSFSAAPEIAPAASAVDQKACNSNAMA